MGYHPSAVREDGEIELKASSYPIEAVATKLLALPIQAALGQELAAILRTGKVPPGL